VTTDAKREAVDRFQRAVGACTRAIARRPGLDVQFRAGEARRVMGEKGEDQLRLPVPRQDLPAADLARIRGEADGLALRVRHHDAKLHQKLAPQGELAHLLYDKLEQVRVEALGVRWMDGVRQNLEQAHRARGPAEALAATDADLSEIVELFAREQMLGFDLPAPQKAQMERWREWLATRVATGLDQLGEVLDEQELFARRVRDMLVDLGLSDEPLDAEGEDTGGEDSDEEPQSQEQPDQGEGEGEDRAEQEQGRDQELAPMEEAEGQEEDSREREAEETTYEPGGEEEGEAPPSNQPRALPPQAAESGYRVYTQAFDEVVTAEELCGPSELTRLRAQLDQSLARFQAMIGKIANRLQRKLLAQQQRSWHFDLDEGLLDAARLARVVINPTHALSFKQETETEFRDTVVTLLIDNSGSMRGRPIAVAAMSADILARTLERCGVKVEILGFTTRAWKGGQAREQWLRAGKPAQPGRLNDLRHIIYKPADLPLRRARRNLGLMLREGLLKENIDGEAILWAYNRLLARPEERRILMVISDGAPVDDSTLSTNPGNYLEKHLREVIEFIETQSPVELLAIGIGHDVTRYYRRAVTISDPEQLGTTMLRQLGELFTREGHSRG
jgi:cobaltochelatase CobT